MKIELPNSEALPAIAEVARKKLVGYENHKAHVKVGSKFTTVTFTEPEQSNAGSDVGSGSAATVVGDASGVAANPTA
jgi:hypothetical protein